MNTLQNNDSDGFMGLGFRFTRRMNLNKAVAFNNTVTSAVR